MPEHFWDFPKRFPELQLLYPKVKNSSDTHYACMKGYGDPVHLCAAVPPNHNAERSLSVAFDIPLEWEHRHPRQEFEEELRAAGISLLAPITLKYYQKPCSLTKVVPYSLHIAVMVQWPGDIIESALWPEFQRRQAAYLLKMQPIVDRIYKDGRPRSARRR